MNSRTIIGSLLAGLILWLFQFLSWAMLDLHYSEMQYTDQQETILEALEAANLAEGDYMLPRGPKGDIEAGEKMMEASVGKPWAMIQYRSAMKDSMTTSMIRGFLIDLIAAFLLIWIFGKMDRPSMGKIVTTCIAIGIIGYLMGSYLNSIWFEGKSLMDLVDAVVSMGIVGAFLGWWLNRD